MSFDSAVSSWHRLRRQRPWKPRAGTWVKLSNLQMLGGVECPRSCLQDGTVIGGIKVRGSSCWRHHCRSSSRVAGAVGRSGGRSGVAKMTAAFANLSRPSLTK